jgi:hypothetical protein
MLLNPDPIWILIRIQTTVFMKKEHFLNKNNHMCLLRPMQRTFMLPSQQRTQENYFFKFLLAWIRIHRPMGTGSYPDKKHRLTEAADASYQVLVHAGNVVGGVYGAGRSSNGGGQDQVLCGKGGVQVLQYSNMTKNHKNIILNSSIIRENQCWGSVTFWCGSGSTDPYL